jgi:hypothetical protein
VASSQNGGLNFHSSKLISSGSNNAFAGEGSINKNGDLFVSWIEVAAVKPDVSVAGVPAAKLTAPQKGNLFTRDNEDISDLNNAPSFYLNTQLFRRLPMVFSMDSRSDQFFHSYRGIK